MDAFEILSTKYSISFLLHIIVNALVQQRPTVCCYFSENILFLFAKINFLCTPFWLTSPEVNKY